MRHGSLFSGIGGFDLAAEWMGWENVFHCEWNEFGKQILKYYWPKAISYGDITKTDFTIHRGTIDVLSGGFPCQDASIANQNRNGLQGNRTGLFWEMLRVIEEINPKIIVAENVENIIHINNGRDFRTILFELGRLGYNAEWRICRASEVGCSHHRSRMYLVAYPNCIRLQKGKSFFENVFTKASEKRRFVAGTTISVGISWPIEPSVCRLDDGLPTKLDGITFSKWRNESIKGYGNAVVPQIPYQIFKAIEQFINQ